jgi:hypothetical protein
VGGQQLGALPTAPFGLPSLYWPLYDRIPGVGRALVISGQGVRVDSRRNVRISMTETCGHRRLRHAAREQVRRVRVAERVETAVLDSGFGFVE